MDVPVSANQYFGIGNGTPGNFTLPAGKIATFTASGTWLTHPHGPNTPWNGPAGNGVPNHGQYPCPGPESCMVIFYAPLNPPVGSTLTVWDWFKSDNEKFTVSTPGTYYFVANDDTYPTDNAYNDNQGIINVHVIFIDQIELPPIIEVAGIDDRKL
jgi:hypothetical protein